MDDYVDRALKRAMEWANGEYPGASLQHRAAFANAVAYLMTGASGGYGGPSLREHLVSWSLDGSRLPGQFGFEEAATFAAPLCFEPASKHAGLLIQIRDECFCFDDDPADVAFVESLRGKK